MPNHFRRSATKRGFTLIELLVVIAIIAILAAILFPVFARARENARRASCQSNLKQIGLGLIQYSQDYDETLVAYGYATGGTPFLASNPATGNYKWMDAIYPYVKSEQVYNCPSMGKGDQNYRYAGPGGTAVSSVPPYQYGSYSINQMYRVTGDNQTPPASSYQPVSGPVVYTTKLFTASSTLNNGLDRRKSDWRARHRSWQPASWRRVPVYALFQRRH